MDSLGARLTTFATSAQSGVGQVLRGLTQTPRQEGPLAARLRVVTPLGWAVLAIGAAAWVAGWWLGWAELMVAAATCLLLCVAGALFVLRPATLRVEVGFDPTRVAAGEPSAGQVTITNPTSRRSSPLRVDLPVGDGTVAFDVPGLAAAQTIVEPFVVPTSRRGIIPVGPATSAREDPVGLFRREAAASAGCELIVHPRTVALEPFGSGLLRDLEGLTTKDLSTSDLAFHALRDYAPGDDRRHVHWRTSAKVGRLLVRQFLDTRRSSLCVVVDGRPDGYGDPEEFEVALGVAGSIARRASRDELRTVLAAGDQAATGTVAHVLLDSLARARLEGRCPDLATLAGRAAARGADISFAIVIDGSAASGAALRRAAARFAPEVGVLTIRVIPGAPPAVGTGARGPVAQLGALGDLARLLRSGIAA